MATTMRVILKAVGTVLGVFLLTVLIVALWSFVAVFLWNEFRGAFGWPNLSYWQMFCLGLFVDMLLPHFKYPSRTQK